MTKIFIIILFLYTNCTSIAGFDCSSNRNYARLDSVLSNNNQEEKSVYFTEPGFATALSRTVCKRVGDFHTITYVEIKPLLNNERSGILYLHDNGRVYSFYRKNNTAKLKFVEGAGPNKNAYKLLSLLKSNFKKIADSLEDVSRRSVILDAPLVKMAHISDTLNGGTYLTYILPYDLEAFE
jgi:hypothetical protein